MFLTAPFLLLDLWGQWSLAKLSSPKAQAPATSQGSASRAGREWWEGVTDCSSGSIEFHRRKLPSGDSAPGLCWSTDTARGCCRSSEGSEGFELEERGCSHLCSCCELPAPGTFPQLSWEAHTATVPPGLLSPCPVPIPGQSTAALSGHSRAPAAPRASVQHHTGALTSNSFSSNVFSRCWGITSLNPFWSARN